MESKELFAAANKNTPKTPELPLRVDSHIIAYMKVCPYRRICCNGYQHL